MKKIILSILLLAGFGTFANACTNFIVGKKASADGSVICSYNADDYGMFIGLCHYPAMKHAPGTMRQVKNWDTGVYQGQIPEAAETYNVIGNINYVTIIFLVFVHETLLTIEYDFLSVPCFIRLRSQFQIYCFVFQIEC